MAVAVNGGRVPAKAVGGLLLLVAVATVAHDVQAVLLPLVPVLVAVLCLVVIGSWLLGRGR